jgi:outer membrane lipoprotein
MEFQTMTRSASILAVVAALTTGCAAGVPRPIRDAPPDNPALNAVRADPAAYTGRAVRWGGTIARVDNRATETRVEIVERALERYGRPRDTDVSGGRFLARFDGFLDPSVYAKDRQLTVTGMLAGSEAGKIGEHPYTYPVVRVEAAHLWPPLPEPTHYRDPYWYDPWWPSHPWGYPYPYPYRRYPY